MDEINFENEQELLNSLETILSSTECNLHEYVDDTSQMLAINNFNPEFHKHETNGKKIHTFFNNFSTSCVDISKDNAEKILALESKCEQLRAQIEKLNKEKKIAFEEIERLKDQISSQTTYCTSLGAVLGNLTWRASNLPQIVDIWLSRFQNKIEEFLSIVNGTFEAFINTYRSVLPAKSNVEYQFVMGLLGIITNISATAEGREFLITNSNGTEFVQKIIKRTPELPSTTESLFLKRLVLMILYNVSMNKTGLQYLLKLRVGDVLNHCLEVESSSEEVQLLCLRVLQSITYDLTEPKYIRDVIMTISIERIETMMLSKRDDISSVAKNVIKHLRDSQKITM